ncbi:hypothetical protein ACFTZF_27195 [Streptomyces mirabilis]|uniref:hypothetical protein n=1 Tax=Streptomyces mirabilis TaxID=68239 RepID=UPI003638F816
MASADGRGVLAVGDVADEVQPVLDAPLRTAEPGLYEQLRAVPWEQATARGAAPAGSAPRRSAGLPGHTWPSTRRMAAAEGAMRTANAVTLRAPRIARVHWGASAA